MEVNGDQIDRGSRKHDQSEYINAIKLLKKKKKILQAANLELEEKLIKQNIEFLKDPTKFFKKSESSSKKYQFQFQSTLQLFKDIQRSQIDRSYGNFIPYTNQIIIKKLLFQLQNQGMNLQMLYRCVDSENDRDINLNELQKQIKIMIRGVSDLDILRFLKIFDEDLSGTLPYQQYKEVLFGYGVNREGNIQYRHNDKSIMERIATALTRNGEDIEQIFDRLDENKQGWIDGNILMNFLEKNNLNLKCSEQYSAMRTFDPLKQNMIQKGLFCNEIQKGQQSKCKPYQSDIELQRFQKILNTHHLSPLQFFKISDLDNQDQVTSEKFQQTAYKLLNQDITEMHLKNIIQIVDPKSTGKIQINEFVLALLDQNDLGKDIRSYRKLNLQEEQMYLQRLKQNMEQNYHSQQSLFKKIDRNSNGVISLIELRNGLFDLGLELSSITVYMNIFDQSNDGTIQLDQFLRIFKQGVEGQNRGRNNIKPIIQDQNPQTSPIIPETPQFEVQPMIGNFVSNQNQEEQVQKKQQLKIKEEVFDVQQLRLKLRVLFLDYLDENKISQLKIIKLFGADQSGSIDYQNFLDGIKIIGRKLDLSERERVFLVKQIDINNNQYIQVQEFINFLNNSQDQQISSISKQNQSQTQESPDKKEQIQKELKSMVLSQSELVNQEYKNQILPSPSPSPPPQPSQPPSPPPPPPESAQQPVIQPQNQIANDIKVVQIEQKIDKPERELKEYNAMICEKLIFPIDEGQSRFVSLKQGLQKSESYYDQDFPPELKSLTKDIKSFEKAKNFQWRRAVEIFNENFNVIQQEIEPGDILQGSLGDCYFLSSLSVLAERENLVKRLFESIDVNQNGIYSVWLCHDGQWKEIVLDDYFPCQDDKSGPVFSKGHGNEIWVLLLEKAYAQVYGAYDQIEAGLTCDALRDLTGAPGLYMQNEMSKLNEIWDFITEHDSKGHLLTCGSQSSDKGIEFKNETGIVAGHAYAILDARELKQQQRIIRLRNPWGSFQWQGDWSDGSSQWTPQLKKQLNVTDENDGIFWMPLEDFVKEFAQVSVTMIYPDYLYTWRKINFKQVKIGETNKALLLFEVTDEDTHSYISISQQDERNFAQIKDLNYQYSMVSLVIAKIQKMENFDLLNIQYLEFVAGNHSCSRDTFIEYNFRPGTYIIHIQNDPMSGLNNEFVVSAYSKNKISFLEQTPIELKDHTVLDGILKLHPFIQQDKLVQYEEEEKIQKYNDACAGYMFFIYKNQSKGSCLQETVEIKGENLKICHPFTDNEKFVISLNPGNIILVKFQILPEGKGAYSFSVGLSYRVTKHFTDDQLIEKVKNQAEEKNQRSKNNQPIEVFVYQLFYDEGLAMLYENKTQQTYTEQLQLNVENLIGDNCDISKEIVIKISPNELKLLQLKPVDPSKAISINMSYSFNLT